MKEFCALRAKRYSCLMNHDTEHKEANGTKQCVIKRRLMLKTIKIHCLTIKPYLNSWLRFKSDLHEAYTEEVNKISLSSDDDKRFQIFDRVTTYPYGTNVFKICESEMIKVRDLFFESYED